MTDKKTAIEICDEALGLMEEDFIKSYEEEDENSMLEISETLVHIDQVRKIFVGMWYRKTRKAEGGLRDK